MELARAKEILTVLADGVDPYTGEIFPPNSPYQQPDVIRALYMAINALAGDCGNKVQKKLPDNAGTPWTREQEEIVISCHNKGMTVKEIAAQMRRTDGSIKARLEKLGLMPG
jgi:DNA-binding NarL/FixJ family response regulator